MQVQRITMRTIELPSIIMMKMPTMMVMVIQIAKVIMMRMATLMLPIIIILTITMIMSILPVCVDSITHITDITITILIIPICTGILMILIIMVYLYIILMVGGDLLHIMVGVTDLTTIGDTVHITTTMVGETLIAHGGDTVVATTVAIIMATTMAIGMATTMATMTATMETATTIITATTCTHQMMYTTDPATISVDHLRTLALKALEQLHSLLLHFRSGIATKLPSLQKTSIPVV